MPDDASETVRSVHGPDIDPQNGSDVGRLLAYPTYKSTDVDWIGKIPEHWDMVRGRYLYILDPKARETAGMDPTTTVSFVPMEAVGEYGELSLSKTAKLGSVRGGYTYFRNGDVIVAKITPCFENGKGALADDLCSGIAFGSTEFFVLRPNKSLDPKFLLYITQSRNFRDRGEAEMVGAAGQKRVPPEFVYEFPVPTPGLDEQRAIAAFLDRETAKIDALIEKKAKVQYLYDQRYMHSISSVVFGGRPNFDGISKDKFKWYRVPSYEHESPKIGQLLYRPMAYGILKPEWTDEGVPVLRITDITAGTLDPNNLRRVPHSQNLEYDRTIINEGDLVVSVVGTLGSAAVVDNQIAGANLTRALARLAISDREISAWVRAFFETPEFQHFLELVPTGTAQRVLNLEDLRNVRIPLPTNREQLRERLAEVASEKKKRDTLTSLLTTQIGRLREYRTALISAAVTGQIDVRGRV